ncbi:MULTISPECIES: hypothetical protein [unclassified Streptomyces]|uniref:hypothetical protein n=1 Tax=unclassified Streptomyces TaxID=2593676 RepID=UPI00340A01B9
MSKSSSAACVEPRVPSPRRLGGSEAVVIVIVICLSSVLATVAGMTVPDVLRLLAGAGTVAALVIGLVTQAPLRSLRRLLGALLAPSL